MNKRLAFSFALFSAIASSTAFAQWPSGTQNGLYGVAWWLWAVIVVVVVAVVYFVLKGKKK